MAEWVEAREVVQYLKRHITTPLPLSSPPNGMSVKVNKTCLRMTLVRHIDQEIFQ